MIKAILFGSIIFASGETAQKDYAVVVDMGVCRNMVALMNQGQQPKDMTIYFFCRPAGEKV